MLNALRRSRALVPAAPIERAPPIASEITEIEERLGALSAERPEIALGTLSGHASAVDRLAEIDAEAAALAQRLSVLRAALAAAEAADQGAAEQRQAALRAQQVAEVQRHLEARDAAAERLSTAIAAAVLAYHDLLTCSHAAELANAGSVWPEGSRCSAADLRRLVDAEVYRQGAGGPAGFPCSTFFVNPSAMRPLTEQLQAATRFTLDQLRSPPAVRRPAPPAAGPAPVPETAPMAV